jgi:4-hydroxy-2-oxoheptanedioate aldolase
MPTRTHLPLNKLADGDYAIGLALQLDAPDIVEVAGAAGFDFAYFDCEHGSFYLEGLTGLLRAAEAAGVTSIARVPSHDPSFIMRVLDAGAMGVILPNVATAEQARAAVAASKYKTEAFPFGTRGACPGTRASWHQSLDWPAFTEWSNRNTTVWALIESEKGVRNAREIAAVPGLHALMLGQFDLSHAMGLPGQPAHPAVEETCLAVIAAARASNVEVVASLFSHTPAGMAQQRRHWLEAGCRILVAGSDRRILYNGMTERVKALRG